MSHPKSVPSYRLHKPTGRAVVTLPDGRGSRKATLPYLPAVVADMVRLQRLTGARPGEIVQLRAIDITRTGDIWEYRPERHKTEHHDRERVIFFGPQAQAIIQKYLGLDLNAPLFRPEDSEAERSADRRQRRKTPLWASHLRVQAEKKQRRNRRGLNETYDVAAYRRARSNEFRVKANELYGTFKDWCKRSGEAELTQRDFGNCMTERGLERFTNNETWYRGIALNAATEPTEPSFR